VKEKEVKEAKGSDQTVQSGKSIKEEEMTLLSAITLEPGRKSTILKVRVKKTNQTITTEDKKIDTKQRHTINNNNKMERKVMKKEM
jgi:hypothetical protein